MKIITLEQIYQALEKTDILPPIEEGFIAYSSGRAVVPPVGELLFEDPPGDVHIKYGYIQGDPYYVIKIASGFYFNPQLGLPSSNGMMLMFSQKTGEPVAILLDEGRLTDLRTAAAGAIAARYLAPLKVNRIGIVGAGIQARQQLRYLQRVTECREVMVWGMNLEEVERYKAEMKTEGFQVETTLDTQPLAETCNLIVTVTPSRKPLLKAEHIQKGTHITAVGADTPGKQELETSILAMADVVVVDSISQVVERGECQHAVREGLLKPEDLREMGSVIAGDAVGRQSDDQITIADLTGVAVQDIQITRAVYEALLTEGGE
jgi:ornithine cyclodeaminase